MSFLQTAGLLLIILLMYALLLVSCENKIIYHPYKYPDGFWDPQSVGINVEDVYFSSADGLKLHAWFVPVPKPVATLLWFHGNAGNISHRLDNIQRLLPLNLNVFIFDYRGYGRSEGTPDEKGIYLDSQAAYDVLVKTKNIPPEKLFLFGRSLGGVCAAKVAQTNPAAGLIMESVFTSARDMAGKLFPFLPLGKMIRSKMDAVGMVPGLTMPKLFLHGTQDEIVPYKLGRKLFAAAADPKEFYDIEGAGHNDTYIVGGEAYFQAIRKFIVSTLEQQDEKKVKGGSF